METSFTTELREILNKYNKESESNTPDYVLCVYILDCLTAFNAAVGLREIWYGREHPEPIDPTDLAETSKGVTV